MLSSGLVAAMCGAALSATMLAGCTDKGQNARYILPAEGSKHASTWMAFGATESAWGSDATTRAGSDLAKSRSVARADLMRIAAAVSRFEPVNMLVSKEDLAEAKAKLAAATREIAVGPKEGFRGKATYAGGTSLPKIGTYPVTFHIKTINDLWTRDTAPVFVRDRSVDDSLAGVNLNFNGWGQEPVRTGLKGWRKDRTKAQNGVLDQDVDGDMEVASFILSVVDVAEVSTWLTAEGGGIEVSGTGLAIVSESCIINPNRNPGKNRTDVEAELQRLFGIEKVLWVPGEKAMEITDGHIDFYARFVTPDHIVHGFDSTYKPDSKSLRALEAAFAEVNKLPETDKARLLGSASAALKLSALPVPDLNKVRSAVASRNSAKITTRRDFDMTFAAGYIGYYEANGAIVMAQFGDDWADKKAFEALQKLFPEKVILSITTDGIANGGGTIHCSTQQELGTEGLAVHTG